MSILNLDKLLAPLSDATPCGTNLEYDPAFLELDRLSEGKPEQQIGKTIIPAQEPDWKQVAARSVELLEKTKDLRIAMHLTRALLRTNGFSGMAEGLSLLEGLLARFWDQVYPMLDPEDDNDPTLRVNLLNSLTDQNSVLDHLRSIPLVSSRSIGRFSYKDILVSTGELPPPQGTTPPNPSAIDGAFSECPTAELQDIASTIQRSLRSLSDIESVVTDKVGSDRAPSLAKVISLYKAIEKILSAKLANRSDSPVATGDSNNAEPTADGRGGAHGSRPAAHATGEINSPADVVRMLDRIIDYYNRCEPSSPIPMLLKRSKRLVSANFWDILQDIAPDAISQVEVLRGKDESSNS